MLLDRMEGIALLEEAALLDTMKEIGLLDRMKEIALLEWVATLDTKEQAAPVIPHPTSDASHQPEHSRTQTLKETPQTSTTPAERATERLAW